MKVGILAGVVVLVALLVFLDREEGLLEIQIEQLALTGFQTWEPERPGQFELTANVNDIDLNWTGEARPFADTITLDFETRTTHYSPYLVDLIGVSAARCTTPRTRTYRGSRSGYSASDLATSRIIPLRYDRRDAYGTKPGKSPCLKH